MQYSYSDPHACLDQIPCNAERGSTSGYACSGDPAAQAARSIALRGHGLAESSASPFSDPVFDQMHDANYVPEPFVPRPSVRYTNRSYGFCMAYDMFFEIRERERSDNLRPYQLLGEIEGLFLRWLGRYKNSYIKIVNRSERKAVLSQSICRFMEPYKRRLWKKYGFLDSLRWDKMLTLTVDPEAFDYWHDEYALVMKGWDKLRAALRKKYGDFTFVRVLEIQKTGRPHLHILIHGITEKIDIWWVRNLWAKYGIGIQCHIGDVWRKDLKALCYVMKYIKKTLNGADPLYASLLFASNRRQWGFSIGRRLNLDNTTRLIRTEGLWEFEGFCHRNEVICLSCAGGVPFEETMFLTNVPFEDFPRVFGNTHTKNGLGAMGNTTDLVFRHGDKSQLLSGLG